MLDESYIPIAKDEEEWQYNEGGGGQLLVQNQGTWVQLIRLFDFFFFRCM